MIGGGGRYDRAACQDMNVTYRAVVRPRQIETAFAARAQRQSTPQRAAQHIAVVPVNLRC